MKKKTIKNDDQPIGKLKGVEDLLPPPDQLVMPDETVKVTLSLTKASVDFFKQEAKRHHVKYQKMIRQLVDRYAKKY